MCFVLLTGMQVSLGVPFFSSKKEVRLTAHICSWSELTWATNNLGQESYSLSDMDMFLHWKYIQNHGTWYLVQWKYLQHPRNSTTISQWLNWWFGLVVYNPSSFQVGFRILPDKLFGFLASHISSDFACLGWWIPNEHCYINTFHYTKMLMFCCWILLTSTPSLSVSHVSSVKPWSDEVKCFPWGRFLQDASHRLGKPLKIQNICQSNFPKFNIAPAKWCLED